MKITIEFEENSISFTESDDLDIHQLLEVYERLTLAQGYHPNSWKDGILSLADEYEEVITKGQSDE
jgi:hypothetical protein